MNRVALTCALVMGLAAVPARAQVDEGQSPREPGVDIDETTPGTPLPAPAAVDDTREELPEDAAPEAAGAEPAPPPIGVVPPDPPPPTGEGPGVEDEPPREGPSPRPVRLDGPNRVEVYQDSGGFKLRVDGQDMMVYGMNWAYMPIGENYTYDFWGKPDEFIREALHGEMTLLRDMGVNAVRIYVGIPKKWITYIYENYGIYTVLNHAMGRYGHSIDGVWRSPTNYADRRTREVLVQEMIDLVESYKDTPGLLMWLLGNENNYGLYWSSNEIEDLPQEQQGDQRARYLYSLFGEAIDAVHARDSNHPVAIANGDLQFLDVIKEECGNLDIMGSNVYRGPSSRDLFDRVSETLGVPFMYTEFGSDAYNAREGREDGQAQAEINLALWQEIYEQSHGKGRAGNAIGGLIFQWSDGWWKYRQDENLDIHDETASWATAAYQFDYVEGENNMNEEWFGICAKGRSNSRGIYRVYCRSSYYVLRDAFKLDPYGPRTTLQAIRGHFGAIRPRDAFTMYAAQQSMNRLDVLEMVRVGFLRLDFETYTTGGRQNVEPGRETTTFDHTESFYFGIDMQPAPRVRANVTMNVLGNVAQNPIDEIFYENRGIPRTFTDVEGEEVTLSSVDRIAVYQSSFSWEDEYFKLDGFFRVGQNHWGYEGDFFHLYPETYYGEAVDAFNANVPIGVQFEGRRELQGLKIAFGPELWWGANPTIIGKYHREIGPWAFSFMHQEDFDQREPGTTSSVIPTPQDRKTTVYVGRNFGPVEIELGGIMAGSPRVGREWQGVREVEEGQDSYLNSGYALFRDEIRLADTFGARAKITVDAAPFYWYIQGGYQGLVADAGWDPTITFTGWSLKESGQGNHWAVSTGAAYNIGKFQIAPNFLIQQPLEGPLPPIDDYFDPVTGIYYPGTTGRNQLNDPFWVRSNRETYGFELLIAFDPTPETWMWAWDNIRREDAVFAAALDMTYRIHPTIQDAAIGVNEQGIVFPFPFSAPAENLWDVGLRTIVNFAPTVRLVNNLYVGNGQANGIDDRLILRYGTEGRLTADRFALEYFLRFDDWGPYDYYRDFNSTFPVQMMLDASFSLANPQWFVPAYTRFGIRGQFRSMDENTDRFRQIPTDPTRIGYEWEIRTYVQLSL